MDLFYCHQNGTWCELTGSAFAFTTVAVSLCALLIWRYWEFTLRPILYPKYAQKLPYSVPILGHALSFFRDAEGTMTRGRMYFGNKREPFALTIMGETIYIITSAADVSTVYRRTDDLTFDAYITDTMANMGASPDATRRMWQAPQSSSKSQFANPKNEPLAHLSLTIFQHQLHPGKPMEQLEAVLLDRINKKMSWKQLRRTPKAIVTPGEPSTVSLLEWTTSIMLEGATQAFFGEALLKIDPNMLDDYSYFDKHSWKLIYKIPPPWSSGMRRARDRVRSTFARYFNLPVEERSDACWMVKALEVEMRACGIGPGDIGAYLMSIYWVINGNAWKLAFWMLVYIFDDEALFTDVQAEARRCTAISDRPSIIVNHLESSPVMLSVWHEALRFCTSAITIRDVARETQIGNKILKAGARVIVPYKQMLRDSDVFGHDAEVFRPARFLENKDLVKSPSFRPFGGGMTYCPGRFLAKKEVLLFVTLVLVKFDVRKRDRQGGIPRLEEKRPCLGVLSAREGDDLLISVTPATV
ncbi:cytochrome P450 [Delitschia confertaspora ATCC 74209]|uniref:Cytochrome P450 n=1 Tax=Delitschia confertaspora ATCC 74209 TaxID=1513339 RepID=A0A9P4MZV3_9PLEO|nr:cytochrome P450 [Delitschia confertaspora ATCC 74209]